MKVYELFGSKVLYPKEIEKLIGQTSNLKYKCIIALEYSAGLRIGEIANLKVNQLDFPNGKIWLFAEKEKNNG